MLTPIEIIQEKAVIPIEISSGFYQRIQNMLMYILDGKTKEQIADANAQIEQQKITEPWVAHYETLLIICTEIELQARSHKMTEIVDVDLEDF